MNVTAEQWAQAEAERQAEMVQTLFNEVRRMGTVQSNNLQEIQRLRAGQFLTVLPVEPSEGADAPPSTTPAGREIGKPLVFSGDESTWGRLEFQVAFLCVSGRQLGRMMEAAELAAHASVWILSEPLKQDMDAPLRYLLVMLTSGPALQVNPTTAKRSTGIPRSFARRYNPRSQARSLAQLQEIMHFDSGRSQLVSQIE